MAGGGDAWRGRTVISKVTAVLDAFGPATPELSLGDLARITGLPVSTTYRLVAELVEWGGLERASGGTGYRVGVRMGELGALALRSTTLREGWTMLREVAQPFMQDLCEATRENVHLAVLDGREALVRSGSGGRLPLHATGVGKVLLAHAPEQLLREVLEAGLRQYTPHTVVTPGHLLRALARGAPQRHRHRT